MSQNKSDHGEIQDGSTFAQLMKQARDGNADATGQLIDRWRNYLLLIANEDLDRKVQAKIAPSDIVQQSMIDAHQHFGDYRGSCEAEFRAWVRKILTNNLNEARRRYTTSKRNINKEISIDDSATAMPHLKNPQESPRSDALKNERMNVLESAMKQLPGNYQQVIQLRNWNEETFSEIAVRMDCGEDSARKLWARAVLKLQQEIQKAHPGYQSGTINKSD